MRVRKKRSKTRGETVSDVGGEPCQAARDEHDKAGHREAHHRDGSADTVDDDWIARLDLPHD